MNNTNKTPPLITGDEETLPASQGSEAPLLVPAAPPAAQGERYALQGEIARGGLGRIIRAHDQRLRRPVALKQLLRPRAHDEVRFLREALLTARLEHPSIIPVHDAGVDAEGNPFYAMKLVGGRSLAAVLSEKKTLPDRMSLLSHVINVCEALAYAHSQHIIHRDLKPHNVLVGPFGETVVIDWGLAKDLQESNSNRTSQRVALVPPSPEIADTLDGPLSTPHTPQAFTPIQPPITDAELNSPELTMKGSILGTPAYMPPEQARGESVDERADVYSLGAILYHLLTGSAPYHAKSNTDAIKKLLVGPPRSVRELQPLLPRDLVAIVEKAMQRAPEARYPSAKELAEDLKKFQTGQLVSAYQYSNIERLKRFLRRNRLVVTISAVLLTALISLGAFSYAQIISERNQAEASRDEAIMRADEALLGQASLALSSDPGRSMSLLSQISAQYPKTGAMRLLAADAISRGLPKLLNLPGSKIIELAFRPNSDQFVALHQGGGITLTSSFTWETRQLVDVPNATNLIFSSDGSRLAIYGPEILHLYSMTERESPQLLRGHSDRILSVAFSPDGEMLASGGQDRVVYLWDLSCKRAPCKEPVRLVGHPNTIYSVLFSPDGKLLASAGRDGALFLWDLTQPTPTSRALVGHSSNVSQIQFFSDSKSLISAGRDGVIRIWSTESATLAASFTPPQYGASDFALSPDEKHILVGSSSGFLWVWNLPCVETKPPDKIEALHRCGHQHLLGKHDAPIDLVSFTEDSMHGMAFSYGGRLSLWDLHSGSHRDLETSSREAFLSPNKDFLLTTAAELLRVWPLSESHPLQNFDDKKGTPLAFSSDMKLLAYTGNYEFRLYNTETKESLAFPAHKSGVWVAAFSPDSSMAASGSQDKTIRLWDLKSKTSIVLEGHENDVRGLTFSPDNKLLASSSWDKTIRIWDVSAKPPTLLRTLRGHSSFVRALSFSPDGKYLASGGYDGQIVLWELTNNFEPTLFHEGLGSLTLLRFLVDGSGIIVANSDGDFWLFDRSNGQGHRLIGHSYTISSIALSSDGLSMASSDATHEIRIWDISRWQIDSEIKNRTLLGHARAIGALGFSLDQSTLLSASEDGSLRSWPDDLPRDPTKLRALIKELATPFLTP